MRNLFLIFMIFLPSLSFATDFSDANSAFENKEYEKAIPLYLQVIEEEGYSVPVLFNLANSYSKINDIGNAVLYYQKAHYLDPGNGDISKNLELIRKEGGLYSQEQNKFIAIISHLSLNIWASIALASLAIITILIFLMRIYPREKKVMRGGVAITSLIMFLAIFSSWIKYDSWQALVLLKDSELKISPISKSESKGPIKAGRLVYEKKTYGDFIYIKDETGRVGWLNKAEVKAII